MHRQIGPTIEKSSPPGQKCGKIAALAWGWFMSCPKSSLASVSLLFVSSLLLVCTVGAGAQISHPEPVQVSPPLLRSTDPPAQDASAADLEAQADKLRTSKLYLDALDYYRAALAKQQSAALLNKVGITELMMQRYREAKKSFDRSIKADPRFADAHNNLGVVLYEEKRYVPAVKEYHKAIALDATSASFFSNLGAALFSKKEFDPAVVAYQHALELDPEVFVRTSRGGVQAQLPSPDDRARYDYTVAKLYAKMGFSDRSLEYLKKAQEEGYKELKNVYKDVEFAELRKDKRFTELMTAKTVSLPE
jgi:tetratricopeptide (TPR) repeat protein